ncbi:hypothetical protein D3C72_1179300 [compost metagenome]
MSDAVERALRFLRNYVTYKFPRHLRAIDYIQRELFHRLGFQTKGDYSLYAARAENLFMAPGVFALDEYGVPLETAKRLFRSEDYRTLDEALAALGKLSPSSSQLDPFEAELIADVQRGLGPSWNIGPKSVS